MRPMVFRDRWVLVTGASSGLGRAMAMKLAWELGASIVAVAGREERLEALRRDVEAKTEYPDEPHARCRIWAIWRMKK